MPADLTGGAATIGVRLPDHASPRALARALGPLPVTSANRSGAPDAHDASEVLAQLGDRIDLVLDGGPAQGGVPSTVVDCSGLVAPSAAPSASPSAGASSSVPRILRVGAISPDAIAAALGRR